MSSVSSIFPPTPAAMAKAAASSSSTSSSTGTSSSSVNSTFMSLLLTELQSQDPTAPMDTTAMVGQMVSLNQLDQLMSIQSILQNSLGSAAASSSGTAGATAQIAANNNNPSTNGVN